MTSWKIHSYYFDKLIQKCVGQLSCLCWKWTVTNLPVTEWGTVMSRMSAQDLSTVLPAGVVGQQKKESQVALQWIPRKIKEKKTMVSKIFKKASINRKLYNIQSFLFWGNECKNNLHV